MDLVVGAILDGKVTGITKFGAFVALDGAARTGMVHISEVANTYVSNIRDHLTEGQQVKVKLISIDDSGRLNLSIKKALPPPPERERPARPVQSAPPPPAPNSFEDKLKQFMADSDSKMSNLYSTRRTSRKRK